MDIITQGLNNTGLNNSRPVDFFEHGRLESSSSSSYVPSSESQTSQSQSQSSQSSDSSMSDDKVTTTPPSTSSKSSSTNKTEMKKLIISNTPTKGLTSHEIANFRAARSIVELITDKRSKHLNICIDGDKLNDEVRGFIKRACIIKVKFMRMQKPINKAKTKKGKKSENSIIKSSDYKSNRDEDNSNTWDGDFQYNCAGRIQSISFEAPPILNKNGIKVGNDFKKLRDFLLNCTGDVFKTVDIAEDNLTTKRTSYRAHLRRQELFKSQNPLELSPG